MDIAQPVPSKVVSASFSFLSSEDIRRISVKQIVNPTLLDNTNLPTTGGLYDPALGPMDQGSICTTCHLTSFSCPGHFGHIELPTPVYHPLFMVNMFQLLRGTCLYCHRFKTTAVQVIKYIGRLRLLDYGLIQEADLVEGMSLLRNSALDAADAPDDEGGDKKEGNGTETVEEFRKRVETYVGTEIYWATKRGARRGRDKGSLVYEARKKTVQEFMKLIQRKKCDACGAFAPSLRKDTYIKITEMDLPHRERAIHDMMGRKRPNALLLQHHIGKSALLTANGGLSAVETPEGVDEDNAMDEDRNETDEGGEEGQPTMDSGSSDDEEDSVKAQKVRAQKKAAELAKKAEEAHARVAGTKTSKTGRVVPTDEVRAHLRLLFHNEPILCGLLYGRHGPFVTAGSSAKGGADSGASADMFFLEVLPVTPTRFRPASVMGDQLFENPQNELLTKILQSIYRIRDAVSVMRALSSKEGHSPMPVRTRMPRTKQEAYGDLMDQLVQLQIDVNCFMDSSKNPNPMRAGKEPPPGVKQILEKKEGLFRKHMMGKRVNFAARSVISPDVNIETNEIGVPPHFAQKLTYPEPVNAHNVHAMRQLVINGPDVYPGASAVQNEDGTTTLLGKLTVEQRTALANQLLTPQEHVARFARGTFGGIGTTTRTQAVNKKVLRHLRDGDILLLNRQPTLHKPSMMAHKARVLKAEKTIRMHYANCNSYNADFDGDEMNMHFPQSQIARAESYDIANTDNQYLVPTSGNPLRGLIQDHVVAGVWMTAKQSFFTREEYYQLIYGALRPEDNYSGGGHVLTFPPAMIKPRRLWTGKQIISTILLNIKPDNAEGLNLKSKAKVPNSYWGEHSQEETVLFVEGELLCGVLDKSQFGATAFGMVHSVYEIYGPETAGKLLSILSRLFTKFLQHRAFTCRMDDLLLTPEGDKWRRDVLNEGEGSGMTTAMRMVGLETANLDKSKAIRNLKVRLEEVIRDDSQAAVLDSEMTSAANEVSSSVIKTCLPKGLVRKFPDNHMQAMVLSGAKGSNVNASQISCLLGAQSLEGRRVPVMVSGKTLPSFKPYETALRAGGFVAQRFLTGIRPQEYYFHCMAGREGLIDTAVKTSRSGYLQRCLIKHLEGVRVHYDYTVRNSDSSILQFHYGEDALDTTKAKSLDNHDFTAQNFSSFVNRYKPKQLMGLMEADEAPEYMKKALKKPEKYSPALSKFSLSKSLGVMSERFAAEVEKYASENPSKLLAEKKRKKKDKEKDKKKGEEGGPQPKRLKEQVPADHFRSLAKVLYLRSLVEPGEAVGLLAAQGIGEPSTQMTLNTFHFAGHGAANVTLGIPRLREIVMTASSHIKTPVMTLPYLEGLAQDTADMFCKDGTRLLLSQVVEEAVVTERLAPKSAENSFTRPKTYTIRLKFFPREECLAEYNADTANVLAGIHSTFVSILDREILKEMRKNMREAKSQAAQVGKGQTVSDGSVAANNEEDEQPNKTKSAADVDDLDDPDGDDDVSDAGDGDADEAKRRSRANDGANYDEDSSEDDEHEGEYNAEDIEAAFADEGDGDDADDGDEDVDMKDINPNFEDLAAKVAEMQEEFISSSKYITRFAFDVKRSAWAEFELQVPSKTQKLLLVNVVERACRMSVLHELPGISRMLKKRTKGDEPPSFESEGCNFKGIWEYGFGLVDLNKIYSNDVAAILRTYGVEAARQAILTEMRGIFGPYGIQVSYRHLSLIADYMTFGGGYRPFNRTGIAGNSSPLLKASFETTGAVIADSTINGDFDDLRSPSASIVMGMATKSGTGSFDVRLPLPVPSVA